MLQKEVVYHRGEQHRIRKNMKSLYIRTKNALIDIKISTIDICSTNIAPKPKTLIFS